MSDRKFEFKKLLLWTIFLLIIVLLIGMIGFRYLVNLSWIDSFQNTTFYMAGLGPVAVMQTNTQKLFAGGYAIIAGIIYLAIAAYLISQIFDLEFIER